MPVKKEEFLVWAKFRSFFEGENCLSASHVFIPLGPVTCYSVLRGDTLNLQHCSRTFLILFYLAIHSMPHPGGLELQVWPTLSFCTAHRSHHIHKWSRICRINMIIKVHTVLWGPRKRLGIYRKNLHKEDFSVFEENVMMIIIFMEMEK